MMDVVLLRPLLSMTPNGTKTVMSSSVVLVRLGLNRGHESNNMRPPTGKADLLPCLEALAPHPHNNPKVDACIVDGAALVHQLEPRKCNSVVRTFGD